MHAKRVAGFRELCWLKYQWCLVDAELAFEYRFLWIEQQFTFVAWVQKLLTLRAGCAYMLRPPVTLIVCPVTYEK